MSRYALLIEASKIKDHDDLPGAREDVEAFKAYLNSPFGGAWEDREIRTLSHPSKTVLNTYLKTAAVYDYALIAFSGHGHHVVGQGIDETRLCINDTEEISVYELNCGCARTLIVADACRKLTILPAEKYAKSMRMALEEASAALHPNRERCRQLFDASLEQAERGAIYFYSCDVHESAADIRSFSRNLITTGEAWAEQHRPGVLRSNEAFKIAAAETTSRRRQQNPKSDAGRRQVHFPFAVLAY